MNHNDLHSQFLPESIRPTSELHGTHVHVQYSVYNIYKDSGKIYSSFLVDDSNNKSNVQ